MYRDREDNSILSAKFRSHTKEGEGEKKEEERERHWIRKTKQNKTEKHNKATERKHKTQTAPLYLSLFPLLVFDMALFHIGYSIYFTVSINIDRSYVQKMLNASRVATRA